MPRSHPSLRQGELISFFEALYRWDLSEQEWLDGLCPPLLALLPRATWVIAQTYDLSEFSFKALARAVGGDVSDAIVRRFEEQTARFTPSMVERTFLATSVASLAARPELFPSLMDVFGGESGAYDRDVLTINGINFSGCSACMTLGLTGVAPLRGKSLNILRRLANHLAWAVRLRQKMAASGAPSQPLPFWGDVKFSRDDRLPYGEAEAADSTARAPREVARHIVARENLQDAYALDALSERERQVVASLARGQSTKEIACSLGIEPSTTRVLIKRAAAKLHVENRAGLLEHPTVKKLCGIAASDHKHLRTPG